MVWSGHRNRRNRYCKHGGSKRSVHRSKILKPDRFKGGRKKTVPTTNSSR